MDFLKTQRVADGTIAHHVAGRRCSQERYDEAWSDAIRRGGRPNSFLTQQASTRSGAAVWRHHAAVN